MERPVMNLTTTAYGTWSGGRYMHYGEMLTEERYQECIRLAYDSGIRTFVTADVYGTGLADQALGRALEGIDRDTYCLVGMVGHDHYKGKRQGSSGFPRFTHPELNSPKQYKDFLLKQTSDSLKNCQTDHFDLLMLHNPDELGYISEDVWTAMEHLKTEGLTSRLGLAPGPANGFTLDMIYSFENFGELIDWTMIILNPLEPWPGQHVLAAAESNEVDILTRVVDYGGLFFDIMKPGYEFKPGDHRAYRPDGWIERGCELIDKMRPIAEEHGITPIQLACIWNLSQAPVKSVVPTCVQEPNPDAPKIEDMIQQVATLSDLRFSPEEVAIIREIGDNTGCMKLKGASKRHSESERPDEWPMRDDLLILAEKYGLPTDW